NYNSKPTNIINVQYQTGSCSQPDYKTEYHNKSTSVTLAEPLANGISVTMTNINNLSQKLINSYQKKICCYDKQQWERSIEDQILFRAENICNHSQSTAHTSNCTTNHDRLTSSTFPSPMTNDLIDLDLISGSAYTVKPKSQQGWLSSFGHAIVRVLFFPLYFKWWSERTNATLTSLLLLLYLLQGVALRLYYHRGITFFTIQNLPAAFASNVTKANYSSTSKSNSSTNEFSEVPPTEVLMPIAMMLVLGVIHTQIVGTKSSNSHSTIGSNNRKTSSINNNDFQSMSSNINSNSKSPEIYFSSCTDQSSTSISSCTSTPPSSVERNRNKKRVKKEKLIRNIPKIKIHDEQRMRDIVLVHDDQESYNLSDEDHVLNKASDNQWNNRSTFQRRYSDSKASRGKSLSSLSFTQCRRRYSESQCHQANYDQQQRSKMVPMSNIGKVKLLKYRSGVNSNSQRKLFRFDRSWTKERHANLKPNVKGLKSYGTYCNGTNGSSYDSEGTVTPVTPIASLPGDDWPMINSDANTSGESDEDNNHYDKQFQNTDVNKENHSTTDKLPTNNCSTYSNVNHHHYRKSIHPIIPETNFTAVTTEMAQQNELKVSCSIWQQNMWQKVDLSVMDLSSAIIRKVENIEHSSEYIYLGIIFSLIFAFLPTLFRMQYLLSNSSSNGSNNSPSSSSSSNGILSTTTSGNITSNVSPLPIVDYPEYLIQVDPLFLMNLFLEASLCFAKNCRLRVVICIAIFERFVLSILYFFLLCVAERTFKQRFLYSKYFSQITRRDRAKRSQVPFFRLHKVSYLKVWLSVRSYLRRHGPLRSVDTICSTSFILAVCLLICISIQLLKDTSDTYTSRLICWEMTFWSLAIGIYIMRLMILGSRINQKYRSNLSVLITEQINLHLQLERKPQKKEDLMLANHVLKLAADLIKELEAPYKISGFSANPYLYNVTKVVVLSAFSALLTEMLGFKLKLDKINLIK
ncbi:Male germ-cell putative homeodomain transcription factor, partial [Blomia tropicalis]